MPWFSTTGFNYRMSDKDIRFFDRLVEVAGGNSGIVMDVLFEDGGGEKDLEYVVTEIVKRRNNLKET